jgi:polysaccharide biosynthesis transport protein
MNDRHTTQNIPHVHHHDEDEINLGEYLHILSTHKWSIIGFAIVMTLLTTLVVFSIEPVYEATATILIESEEENVVSIEEVYGIPGANDEYFETQNQILQSRNIAEKVIDVLKIPTHPEFDPEQQEPSLREKIMSWLPIDLFEEDEVVPDYAIRNSMVGKFRDQLNVSPIRNSQLINITFESIDAELTATVPNTLAKIYISSDLEGRLAMTHKATGSITEQLDELKKNLEASEKALQAFREKEKLIDIEGVDSLAAKELDELTVELVQARRNRTEVETAYRQVTALKGKPIEAYESIPAVLKDKGLQNAKQFKAEAARKVSELEKRYGPKHPKMIAAIDELATANKSVKAQIINVVDSLKKEYEVARAKEGHLSGAMSRTKRDVGEINRKESQLIALERDVEANKNIYETFLSRYKETSAVSELQPLNARVVDPAVIPSKPAKPKKGLIILIALVLSFIIATMIAFLIEALDNTMGHAQDVEAKLHQSVLGILPKLSIWLNKDVKVLRYYTDNNQTPFAENIRTIRSGILLSGLDEKQKVVLVTSSIPGEGKSMTAVNLALSLGQMGKVLLIDCDLRRPSIREVFGLDSKDIGLSHFILGSHTLQQAVHVFEKEHLSVMPAGSVPPNPLEMLSSERFAKALEALKAKYDHIVIDSAPAVAVSDAIVMSQLVNQVIYLIKADETPHQLAREGISRLQKVNAPLVGVVLNQVSPPKKTGRYGHYHGQYYGYYGYGKS